MRTLRRRPRIDTHRNDVRRSASRKARLAYIVLLGAMAYAMLDYLFGATLFLRADGMAIQKKFVVAATEQIRITAVYVSPGTHVVQGQEIAKASSPRVAESLANLTTSRTGHLSRIAELEVRRDQLAALIPSARQRAQDAGAVWEQARSIVDQRLISAQRAAELRASALNLNDQVAAFEAEARSIDGQLADLKKAADESLHAIENLKRAFGGGEIVAPVTGVVGARIASVGEVLTPGNSVTEILAGEKHVLAYLPDVYLFPVGPGHQVRVEYGYDSYPAIISEILPLSDQVPLEFQRVFQPRDRGQLVRISLAPDAPIPVFAKVRIREPFGTSHLARHGRELLDRLDAATGAREKIEDFVNAVRQWVVQAV